MMTPMRGEMWPFVRPPSFVKSCRCHDCSLQCAKIPFHHRSAEQFLASGVAAISELGSDKSFLKPGTHTAKHHECLLGLTRNPQAWILSPTVAGAVQVLLLGFKIKPGSRWGPRETLIQAQRQQNVRGAGQPKAPGLGLPQVGHLLLQCCDLIQNTQSPVSPHGFCLTSQPPRPSLPFHEQALDRLWRAQRAGGCILPWPAHRAVPAAHWLLLQLTQLQMHALWLLAPEQLRWRPHFCFEALQPPSACSVHSMA